MTPRPPSRFSGFWSHVVDRDGEGGSTVVRPVLAFGAFASLVWFVDWVTPKKIDLGLGVAPYEFAGAILGSLLVLRTNAGLDRWYEARKLWGGITNQSRNLAIVGLANGPADPAWRREFAGWIAAFGHAARRGLRRQRASDDLDPLIGPDEAARVDGAGHPPSAVALRISAILRGARDSGTLDPAAYLQAEGQRALLIDHMGGCERILKTPLATAYVVLIRRFIVLFLMTLPFALLRRVEWLTPLITVLVAYPILTLDHIGHDLQHPFSTRSLDHLPLDEITATIEANVFGLLAEPEAGAAPRLTAEAGGG